MMDVNALQQKWNNAADAIEEDPMRPIRYAKGIRYFKDKNRDIKILDVGCGEGSGLAILKEMGFVNLYGVEVSDERARRAQSKLGPSVNIRSIKPDDALPYESDFFDLVISFTVIEHTLSPLFFMKEINRVLKPDATAVISSDCYTWRVLQNLKLYKSEQPVDKAMTPFEFNRVFTQAGFSIQHADTTNLPGRGNMYVYYCKEIVRMVLKKIGINISLNNYLNKINYDLKNYFEQNFVNEGFSWRQKALNYFRDENIFYIKKK